MELDMVGIVNGRRFLEGGLASLFEMKPVKGIFVNLHLPRLDIPRNYFPSPASDLLANESGRFL